MPIGQNRLGEGWYILKEPAFSKDVSSKATVPFQTGSTEDLLLFFS